MKTYKEHEVRGAFFAKLLMTTQVQAAKEMGISRQALGAALKAGRFTPRMAAWAGFALDTIRGTYVRTGK